MTAQTHNSPPDYKPLELSITQVRSAIPPHLFIRDTGRSVLYLIRDAVQAAIIFYIALSLERWIGASAALPETLRLTLDIAVTALYWWFQGLTFTGIWVIGHECGHSAFSPSPIINDVIGFILHTALWTPYFSWKISHHRHHANHGSMERDEVYVPKTRDDLGIPEPEEHHEIDYSEYISDTPLYNLTKLVAQQLLAFPAYLMFNVSGQKSYPAWTNHFDPNSILFRKVHYWNVILSNIGILSMGIITYQACSIFGLWPVLKYYLVPWLLVSHWFVMITYLHHTTPEVPHFRSTTWTFARGASATVDRDFLGWQGRYFLHDVAHFHVVHHFFPMMPWYHGEEATAHLRKAIGKNYMHSTEPVFPALWRSYNDCQFVENTGDVVFYKNQKGEYAPQTGHYTKNLM